MVKATFSLSVSLQNQYLAKTQGLPLTRFTSAFSTVASKGLQGLFDKCIALDLEALATFSYKFGEYAVEFLRSTGIGPIDSTAATVHVVTGSLSQALEALSTVTSTGKKFAQTTITIDVNQTELRYERSGASAELKMAGARVYNTNQAVASYYSSLDRLFSEQNAVVVGDALVAFVDEAPILAGLVVTTGGAEQQQAKSLFSSALAHLEEQTVMLRAANEANIQLSAQARINWAITHSAFKRGMKNAASG